MFVESCYLVVLCNGVLCCLVLFFAVACLVFAIPWLFLFFSFFGLWSMVFGLVLLILVPSVSTMTFSLSSCFLLLDPGGSHVPRVLLGGEGSREESSHVFHSLR